MKVIVDPIERTDWVIQGWKIKFVLSDRLLQQARMISRADHWYDDPVVLDTWMDKVAICFNSIQKFHATFGLFPQIGDRLYNEESGLMVMNRTIDGNAGHIVFTLSL